MKITNSIYDEINTLDELIYALIQLKKKYNANTKVIGSSIINMGMNDNGFDEFETNSNLHVSVFHDEFDNTIKICVEGKCDSLQEQQ